MKFAHSVAVLTAFAYSASAQLQIDPGLAAEIAAIKTIDNHAHPVLPAAGDSAYDALPVEHMDPYTEPVRTRLGSTLAAEATRQLFGSAQKRDLIERKGD